MARKTRQISLQECYDILKLEKDADMAMLKRAYRRRAFELHPDLNPDNPEASHDFQLLNEAYVALSAMLEHEEQVRASVKARRTSSDTRKKSSHNASEAKATSDTSETSSQGTVDADASKQQSTSAEKEATTQRNASSSRQQNAYTEHDVLRDLLNDPFARRVFEDIYSELNRKQKEENKPQQEPPPKAQPHQEQPQKSKVERRITNLHKENIAWGTPKWNKDMSRGVTGMVKGWLRHQIDEEQRLTLPSVNLAPGKRVRLQIRQAFSGELHTIEITLPADFVPGKPIRLRGLGKRVGPWQGDLYLTISSS
ncbi:MAG: DnaJ domain-containing protein [Desulfovibrio sp.]|nr:DnaJ domain-containing protein [Desulfovibrio sp.]